MEPRVPYHDGKRAHDQSLEEAWDGFRQAMQGVVAEFQRMWEGPAMRHIREMAEAELGPADARERALWARQHRNTGPARPSGQNAHAPRRHS